MKKVGTFFKSTVRDVPLEHKVVLVRADYNVPLKSDGSISDDSRIKASLPTIHYLRERGCTIVIMSHMGRPEGRDPKLSLEVVATRLQELLGSPVTFVPATVGDIVKTAVRKAGPGDVLLLENLRYFKEEEADDHAFAQRIATDTAARYFVQDGFGVVHRAHASTHAITMFVPSVAGLLLEKEYVTITQAMESPERPFVAVLGGAKVSDKITVIERLAEKADTLIIGGAMANTFLAYKGHSMGASKVETDQVAILDRIYKTAADKVGASNVDDFIVLPTDVAVASSVDVNASRRVIGVKELQVGDMALDIGDVSIVRMVSTIKKAKTVIWNGTLGYAEIPSFAHGSARLALALATQPKTLSIIGGGDTADFALTWDGNDGASFGHVSTGGGAGLELMAGEKLPGVESLLNTPQ